jgi:hypothetical protein
MSLTDNLKVQEEISNFSKKIDLLPNETIKFHAEKFLKDLNLEINILDQYHQQSISQRQLSDDIIKSRKKIRDLRQKLKDLLI